MGVMVVVYWVVGILVAAVGSFIAVDPWELSPIAEYPHFTALPVRGLRPWREVLTVQDAVNSCKQRRLLTEATIFAAEAGPLAGPESLAFDDDGRGPYTGIAGGRVMRWAGGPDQQAWEEFATITNGSHACEKAANPVSVEHVCGRPLGLRFMPATGELYIADAYFGLMVVGAGGGVARPLVREAEGSSFAFTNDVAIDGHDGIVYFTVTSDIYPRRKFLLTAFAGDHTGRLLSYNPATGHVKVLSRGLYSPNGITLSKDGSFLVLSESALCRMKRFWLKGDKAGTMETFAELPGFPDNVRVNEKGQFWVAIYCRLSLSTWMLLRSPFLRRALLQLPLSFRQLNSIFVTPKPHSLALLLDEHGQVLEVVEDPTGKTVRFISEVEEKDGQLWMGSVVMPHIMISSR